MFPRRAGQGASESLEQSNEMETARSTAESSEKATEPKKEEDRISLFWRVFGGTILSITALVAINIFNNMSSSITELRAEVSREREARAELVKKEEFNARVSSQYERIRGIDAVKVELEGLKEKINTNTTALENMKRDTNTALETMKKDTAASTDAVKKDGAAIDLLKERITAIEALKKDIAGLESLKEKLATATTDLKAVRDEVTKVSGEVEKNKASDLERKLIRDAQHKQVEDTLKELQKAVQDCREKLARLEGTKPAPKQPDSGSK